MKIVLVLFAVLGGQPIILVSDRVPHLNVEALCKDTTAVDQAMKLSNAQSLGSCMRDENAAQQQLDSVWQTTSISIRDRCEGEAVAGGFQSYVDLLTCIQMADDANSLSSPTSLRGASKNRNNK